LLQLGSQGPDVVALQQALVAANFNPGVVDGDFGAGTQAAVLAFQRSEQLVADGIVGPATAAALSVDHLQAVAAPPSALPGFSLQVVSQMFPDTHLAAIKANLPVVLNAMEAAGLADRNMVLMALATIRAETESFLPISEGVSRFNTSPQGDPFDLYDNRKDLGNTGAPDGASFCGRGFVQLTGRFNYTRYSREIEQNLVGDPTLANQPAIAALLLARFLSDNQQAIRQALADNDMPAARKLVNGGSNGLDRFVNAFTIGSGLVSS
jgi:peptidoglycan L-alanyl-D-glutamate endopeptidase CwlK